MAIDFEKIHKRFNGLMMDLCKECGGLCEKTEITCLLLGEVEFVAKKLNQDVATFVKNNCNIIKYNGNNIYMLKAGVCTFLNSQHRCVLEESNSKIITCMLYPVSIAVLNDKVEIFVDTKACPMAHKISDNFKKQAFEIYENIKNEIPKWWLEFTSRYYEYTFDYSKLEKLRNKPIITTKELEKCVKLKNTIL